MITGSQRATARRSTNCAGRYYAMLVSYARLFLMKDDWAEDVVQDVFYNVWQNRARRSTIRTPCTSTCCVRSTTARSTTWTRTGAPANTAPTTGSASPRWAVRLLCARQQPRSCRKLYTDDLRASLDAAIESLPPKCREVFRLSYLEDLSNREISERLGISQSTVENHIYSALKQLRQKLSKEQLLLLLALLFMR